MSNDCSILLNHHQALLKDLYDHCQSQLPFCSGDASETDRGFIAELKELSEITQRNDRSTELGQRLLTRIVSQYPHITPAVNRDLFWYFGGDCLHFMGDEEIERYQQLDELLYQQQQQGKTIDFTEAKASIFHLH